jgi:hypothetical protein
MRPASCDQWTVAALTWYFNEFETEIRIRAFDPDGLHGGMLEPDEKAFKAIRRAREIEKALRTIPWRHQRVLGLVYESRRWPHHVVALFGSELAGIVCTCRQPNGMRHDGRDRDRCLGTWPV